MANIQNQATVSSTAHHVNLATQIFTARTTAYVAEREARPDNTKKQYEKKQKEFADWCNSKGFNDGSLMSEGKAILFLQEKVIGRECRGSRAKAGQKRKALQTSNRVIEKRRRLTNIETTEENEENTDEEDDDEVVEEVLESEIQTISYSTIAIYVAALVDLYELQKHTTNSSSAEHPRGKAMSNLLNSLKRQTSDNRRLNFEDRGKDTAEDGYNLQHLIRISENTRKGCVGANLKALSDFLLSHFWVNRGIDRRNAELCDLSALRIPEGPPSSDGQGRQLIPVLLCKTDKSKRNQHGKKLYYSALRNIDWRICPFGHLGFYLFWRFEFTSEVFPDLTENRCWYNIKLFTGRTTDVTKPVAQKTQSTWAKDFLKSVNVFTYHSTHSGRKGGVHHAEMMGVHQDEICRLGHWNVDTMSNFYMTKIPRQAIRGLARFSATDPNAPVYYPRAMVEPPAELKNLLWSSVDDWKRKFDNEISQQGSGGVQLDLGAIGFLNLLLELRTIVLQDAVLWKQAAPNHPVFKHAVFKHNAWEQFETSVLDAVTDNMQPAGELMRRAAPQIDSTIRNSASYTNTHLGAKIDQGIEQILASVQELKNKVEANGMNADHRLSRLEAFTKKVVTLTIGLDDIVATSSTITIPPNTPPSTSETLFSSDNTTVTAVTPTTAAAATAPTIATGTASTITTVTATAPTITTAAIAVAATATATATSASTALSLADKPPYYGNDRTVQTVRQLWIEWTQGIAGQPSVELMDERWGAEWRTGKHRQFYSRRKTIIDEIQRLVAAGAGIGDAIEELELEQQQTKTKSLDALIGLLKDKKQRRIEEML